MRVAIAQSVRTERADCTVSELLVHMMVTQHDIVLDKTTDAVHLHACAHFEISGAWGVQTGDPTPEQQNERQHQQW